MTTTAAEILLPDAPDIAGLRFRPFHPATDVARLSELIIASNLPDEIDYMPSEEVLRHELEHKAAFDPARDILLAEIDGRVVGAVETEGKVRDGTVVHYTSGWVHPDERRRGIGRALQRWAERRAGEIKAAWSGDEPHAIGGWPDETQPGAIALFEAERYTVVRYGFMMLRPLGEALPDAPLPEGLEIRAVVEADHRRIWEADVEAFRDHWEAAERTEEDFAGWFTEPGLDTSLWRVAWDGDEVAGSVMTMIWADENERLGVSRGWLEHVSVRRPWRRRGLAAALMVDAMRGLAERGIAEAALGVDAENTTGALRLYESLGFRRHRTGINYRKAI
jgi:mycothiol synthase